MLAILGALMLGGALFYIVFTTQKSAETSSAEDLFKVNWGTQENPFKPPFYLKFTKPLLQGAYLNIAKGFWKEEAIQAWQKKIVAAGLGRHISAENFVASKFWLTLIVATFMFLQFIFASSPPPLWFPIAFILGAFFIPNLHISQMRTERQRQVRLAMPYVVDLLALSTEAGLDFMGSISKVVERAPPGPLIEEFSTVLKDIQLGKARAESLRGMALRLDMMEMSSFVAVLVSSDQMGASIGAALRGQSDSMRSERLVRAEKLGAQASQKILIPLVFFILPAVMLIIFGPVILQMLGVT